VSKILKTLQLLLIADLVSNNIRPRKRV
jgi:hypothetical protein